MEAVLAKSDKLVTLGLNESISCVGLHVLCNTHISTIASRDHSLFIKLTNGIADCFCFVGFVDMWLKVVT
jgi:hypothetical protein